MRDRALARAVACLSTAALLVSAGAARAHPAGTSSINRLIDFEYAGRGRFRVAYVLDFAELPAAAELDALDAEPDGAVTPEEQRAYLARRLPPIVGAWTVEVDGQRVQPAIVASNLEVTPGQGGLPTLRIECELSVEVPPPPAGSELTLRVRDDTFRETPGWREIRAGDGSPPDAASPGDPDGGGPRRTSDATFVLPEPGSTASAVHAIPARGVATLVLAALAAGAVAVGARRRRRRPG